MQNLSKSEDILNRHGEILKNRRYKRVLFIQIALIISGFTVVDLLKVANLGILKPIAVVLFLFAGAAYMFFLCDLSRSFISSRSIHNILLTGIGVVFLVAIIVENPVLRFDNEEYRPVVLFIGHFILLLLESLLIYFSVHDLFRGDHFTISKLFGSAALYLMVALAFASLYDLILLMNPVCYGYYIRGGFSSYSESIYYSVNHLIKVSNAFPDSSLLIKRLGILEAVTGELFVALLIGNLLSRPEK